jgi:two-component system sensor kinase FixL
MDFGRAKSPSETVTNAEQDGGQSLPDLRPGPARPLPRPLAGRAARKKATLQADIEAHANEPAIRDPRGEATLGSARSTAVPGDGANLSRWDAILDAFAEPLAVIDEKFGVLHLSPAAERMFGLRSRDILGHSVRVLLPSFARAPRIARAKPGTGPRHVLLGRAADGRAIPVEIGVRETRVLDGQRRTILLMRDLADRSGGGMSARDPASRRDLRRAAMGGMVAALAHELRQPMTAAANFMAIAGICLARLPEDEAVGEAKARLTDAQAQIPRANAIMRRYVSFLARPEERRTPEALSPMLEQAVAFALPDAWTAGTWVEMAVDAGLPLVVADSMGIRWVIEDLVTLALAGAARAAQRRLRVTARAVPEEYAVEITIACAGRKISRDSIRRLFTPGPGEKNDLSGVDLTFSRQIVRSHGGRLSAEPREGGGIAFQFTLPIAIRSNG